MPMSDNDSRAFADAILAARKPGAAPAALPAVVPTTVDEAYRVQDLVAASLGPITGWKVGAVDEKSEPFCSPVLADGIMALERGPFRCRATTGIEVEIAFRMARAFPASAKAPSEAAVVAAIGSAHVAMELCVTRLQTGSKSPALVNLADNGMNFGFVMGPEVAGWRAIDAHRQGARAVVDGKIVVETTGGHSQKDLLKLLVWQVGHVVTRRGGLAAGAVIATGSWTGIHWVEVPAKVAGAFPGLGAMELALIA